MTMQDQDVPPGMVDFLKSLPKRPDKVEDYEDWSPPSGDGGTLDVSEDRGIWYSRRIHPDWMAAWRLVPDRGTPVVAEVRVFPYTPRRSGFGEWNTEAGCPAGGMPSGVLRSVGVTTPFEKLTKAERKRLAKEMPGPAARLGLDPERAGKLRPARTLTPAFLAAVAKTYVEARTDNPRAPMELTADRLGYSYRHAKALVEKATADGFLSKPGRGRSTRTLTEKAIRELEASK